MRVNAARCATSWPPASRCSESRLSCVQRRTPTCVSPITRRRPTSPPVSPPLLVPPPCRRIRPRHSPLGRAYGFVGTSPSGSRPHPRCKQLRVGGAVAFGGCTPLSPRAARRDSPCYLRSGGEETTRKNPDRNTTRCARHKRTIHPSFHGVDSSRARRSTETRRCGSLRKTDCAAHSSDSFDLQSRHSTQDFRGGIVAQSGLTGSPLALSPAPRPRDGVLENTKPPMRRQLRSPMPAP